MGPRRREGTVGLWLKGNASIRDESIAKNIHDVLYLQSLGKSSRAIEPNLKGEGRRAMQVSFTAYLESIPLRSFEVGARAA